MLKKVLVTICSLVLIVCIYVLACFYSTKHIMQKDYINQILAKEDIVFLLNSSEQVSVEILLGEIGLPREYIGEILEQPELKSYLLSYLSSSLLNQEKPLESSTMTKILQQSFSNLLKQIEAREAEWQLSKEETEKIRSQFEVISPKLIQAVEAIEGHLDQNTFTKEIQAAITSFQQFERYVIILGIVLIGLIVLLILLTISHASFLLILGINCILSGLGILWFPIMNYLSKLDVLEELSVIMNQQMRHFARVDWMIGACFLMLYLGSYLFRKMK